MLTIACVFFALFLRSIDCRPPESEFVKLFKPGEFIKPGNKLAGYERAFWRETPLNVCFETRESAYQVEYGLVEQAIKATWENILSPSLKFVFLPQPCYAVDSSTQRHIRILVNNAARPQSLIGAYMRDVPNGMILNFLFTGWSAGFCSSTSVYSDSPIFGRIPRRHFCLMLTAAHEFGHALGFIHEQDREDTPWACRQQQGGQGTVNGANFLTNSGLLYASPYDKDSIMNYCNEKWINDGVLSACDRYGAVKVYRKYDDVELARQCINSTGVCMDVRPPASPQYTCQQQRGWGWCNESWMKGFCAVSCGQCSG